MIIVIRLAIVSFLIYVKIISLWYGFHAQKLHQTLKIPIRMPNFQYIWLFGTFILYTKREIIQSNKLGIGKV